MPLSSNMIYANQINPQSLLEYIYSYRSAIYSSFVKLVIMCHNPKTSFFFVRSSPITHLRFSVKVLPLKKASDYAKRTALARSSLIGTSSSTSKSPMPDSLNSDTIQKSAYFLQTTTIIKLTDVKGHFFRGSLSAPCGAGFGANTGD